MTKWKSIGVVVEREPALVEGLNVWDYRGVSLDEPTLNLPHPGYPKQIHRMWVYEIVSEGKKIRFCSR
jgi:hypothetical protein